MKRLVVGSLAALLLLARLAFGAISEGTFTDYTGADGSATTIAGTFDTSALSSGNLLVVFAGWEDANSASPSVADNLTNTWSVAVVEDGGAGGGPHALIAWCACTTYNASHTITVTIGNAAPYRRIALARATGTFSLASSLDSTNHFFDSGGNTAVTGGNLVTTAATYAVMGIIDYADDAFTATAPWVKKNSGTGRHAATRVEASANTFAINGTMGTTGSNAVVGAAFKESGGGGGNAPRAMHQLNQQTLQ